MIVLFFEIILKLHIFESILHVLRLMQFIRDVSEAKLASRVIPAQIKEHHLQILPQHRFSEYDVCDNNSLIEQFNHGKSRRMRTTIDLQLAENLSTIEQWRTAACDALKNRIIT